MSYLLTQKYQKHKNILSLTSLIVLVVVTASLMSTPSRKSNHYYFLPKLNCGYLVVLNEIIKEVF